MEMDSIKSMKAATKDMSEKKKKKAMRATELSMGLGGNADKDLAKGGECAAGGGGSSSNGGSSQDALHLRDLYHVAFAKVRAAEKKKDIAVAKEQRKIMAQLHSQIAEMDGEDPSENDGGGETIDVWSSDASDGGGDCDGSGAGAAANDFGVDDEDGGGFDGKGLRGHSGQSKSPAAESKGEAARKKIARRRESGDDELEELSREMTAESARARSASEAFEKRMLESHATTVAGQNAILALLAHINGRM